MSAKTELYQRWREVAEAAKQQADQTESRYHPGDYFEANARAEVHQNACRLLSSADGLDHVVAELREQMDNAQRYRALLLADLINELEVVRTASSEPKAVSR